MKELYDTTRKLADKYWSQNDQLKIAKERALWELSHSLTEKLNNMNKPDIQPVEVDLPMKCDQPTKEEIRKAIKQLKNNKAAWPDDISAEILNTGIDTYVELSLQRSGKMKICQQTGEMDMP